LPFKGIPIISKSILYNALESFLKHSLALSIYTKEIERGEKKEMSQMTKFVQSLDPEIYKQLEAIAKQRGITIQALIRQVMGEWLIKEKKES
jgi:predicted DNA-binding ribbon-helix-helix protein